MHVRQIEKVVEKPVEVFIEKPIEVVKYVDRVIEKHVEDEGFKQRVIAQYDKIVADKLREYQIKYEGEQDKETERLAIMVH